MKRHALLVFAALALAACNEDKHADKPAPAPYDARATAQFCGMTLGEHQGPKAQIWVEDQAKPLWFTSVHDAIAFTLLPEEPKSIRAVYVNDMAKAPSWAQAELGGWVDAQKAFYVVASGVKNDMGTFEAVPFSDKGAAATYAREHGGKVVSYDEIPKDQIFDTATNDAPPAKEE